MMVPMSSEQNRPLSLIHISSNLPEELEHQLPSVEDIQKRIKSAKE